MRGIDIGIDTADTRFESTWYRYRKHKSGIAHHYDTTLARSSLKKVSTAPRAQSLTLAPIGVQFMWLNSSSFVLYFKL